MSTIANELQKKLDQAVDAGFELSIACNLMKGYLDHMGLYEEFEEWAAAQREKING